MANRSLWSVCLLLALLLPREVLSQHDWKLEDALEHNVSKALIPSPKPATPGGGAGGELDLGESSATTTTKAPPKIVPKVPTGTKAPVSPKSGGHPSGDSDQKNQYDDNSETTAEVGTIAGIVSAVAMALVGAISSYISYQKKKLCFGIQQSLNTDMVKAENPEAVVATEPQVQQTLLEPPNAEPPTEDNAV
ncbi:CD99 antigen-like protein 2 isoform X3 [Siniperca chuatsi]|uniref:CD99 antigen-like protein 2 isoform X3 n=1 Tax=Siniperca chuatsi TaxID=119488 RepID=UPI001CE053AA|nr:CD99 antigen-like protein 2 isoform X3 [Siniperca chuatsi]